MCDQRSLFSHWRARESEFFHDDITTHGLPLEQAPHGYDIFNKKKDNCVKVVLKP